MYHVDTWNLQVSCLAAKLLELWLLVGMLPELRHVVLLGVLAQLVSDFWILSKVQTKS